MARLSHDSLALGTVPSMTVALPSDDAAQQRIVSDFQTTFLLEAGAGTGKTHLLLNRLLALLRTGRSPLSRIAVITFTEKAADELRVRLRTAVESTLQTDLPEAERVSLRSALSQLDRAMVMTIHAFCAALLRERALEVGLDPTFTVLSQPQARLLSDSVWHDWLRQEFAQNSDLIRHAFQAGLSMTHLTSLRDFLIEQRDCLSWLPAAVDSPLPAYCTHIHAAVARLATVRDCCQDATDGALAQIAEIMRLVPTARYEENPATWVQFLLHRLTIQPRKGKQKNWQPPIALHEARTILAHVKDCFLTARAVWLHNLTVGLARWLGGYVQAYQAEKQQHGSLDFLDLLVFMRDALKQKRELRRYFQRKFDFLLVDEVQDTDPLQAEILFFLAEDKPQTDRWEQVTFRAGKLFLAGDPQQSIYRFRRADLEVYQLVRSVIKRQGVVHTLATNFRMRAALVTWMNDTFSRVFTNESDPDQPGYQPLQAFSREDVDRLGQTEESRDVPTAFLLRLPEPDLTEDVDRDSLRRTEARCTARFIRQIVEQQQLAARTGQPLTYNDIAVLCRTNRSVEIYEAACRDVQIPLQRADTPSPASHQEQVDLQVCVRALIHPADTTALVATLRSSLFGFSDEELAQFRCAGGEFDYLMGLVPAQLPCANHFLAAFVLLRTLHNAYLRGAHGTRMEASSLLAELYARTPLLPVLALRPHGPQRIRRLLRLAEVMNGLDQYGDIENYSIDALDQVLTSAFDEARERQSATQDGPHYAGEALHVLTIHRAKGLEFPLVVVPESDAQPHRLMRMGLVGRKDAHLELRLGPRSLNCCSLGWHEAEAQERQREDAEERRLWYVAASRAREYVIFPIQAFPNTKKKDSNALHAVLHDLSAQVEASTQTIHTVTIDSSQLNQAVISHSALSILPGGHGGETSPETSPSATPEGRPVPLFPPIHWHQEDDIAWLTERRRLIAQGRRKSLGQRKVGAHPNRYFHRSWQQAQLDRLVMHMVVQIRPEQKGALSRAPYDGNKSSANDSDVKSSGNSYLDDLQQKIASSTIWIRLQTAMHCLVHEAFTLHADHAVLKGVIPLAFLEDGQWVVVEFSLEEALPTGKEQSFVHEKLELAALALDRLTKFPVRELCIFFVPHRREISVLWDAQGKWALSDG